MAVGDVLDTTGKLAAAITGIAAAVYVAGAAVFALRLYHLGLPTETVIGDLPRELLISVGLIEVVLPTLIAGAIYGSILLLPAGISGGFRWSWWAFSGAIGPAPDPQPTVVEELIAASAAQPADDSDAPQPDNPAAIWLTSP